LFYGWNVTKTIFDHAWAGMEESCLWAGIFKEAIGLGTGEEEGYRTGPPGYIGWRNSFLGIDSGAPYTFKNTSSELCRLRLSICTGERWGYSVQMTLDGHVFWEKKIIYSQP
jgi:hypothetical protein